MGASTKVAASLACAALLAGCNAQEGDQPTSAQAARPAVHGVVQRQGVQGDAEWIALGGTNARFVVSTSDPVTWLRSMIAIDESRGSQSSLVVQFDPDSGAIDPVSLVPSFLATGLVYEGREVDLGPPQAGVKPAGAGAAAARALARGLGWALARDPARERADLDQALADPTLSPPLRAVGYYARGAFALDQVLESDPTPTDAGDRQLIQGLADFRAAQAQNRENISAAFGAAEALYLLGAYEESVRDYQAAAVKWPKQPYWSAIGVAMNYRTLGENDKSLTALDQLARDHGPQQGMPYHYHRGQTLLQIGRDSEAVDEYSAGLKFQPSYGWAYVGRACALGRLGRITEALADARKARAIFASGQANAPVWPQQIHDSVRMAEVQARLETAAATGKPTPVDAACSGFWSANLVKRSRSALLSDQDAAPPPA